VEEILEMNFVEACNKHFGCNEDGSLFRLAEPGKRVGYVNDKGYVKVGLRKCEIADFGLANLRVHRIVYALVKGVEPDSINHLDVNPQDNRIENLEDGDHRNNDQQKRVHVNGSKLPGCVWHNRDKRWQAQLWYNDYLLYIGYYDSEEEAHKAYKDLCSTLQKTEESLDFSIEVERIIDSRKGARQSYEKKLRALLARREARRIIQESIKARDAEIALAYELGGFTQQELAKQFGVAKKTIQTAIHKSL